MGLTNKGICLKVAAEPTNLNTDSSAFKVSQGFHRKASTGLIATDTELEYGSPNLGPARLWMNLAFHWNSEN